MPRNPLSAADRSARLAEESVPRLLLILSLPAIVGMMAQALYYAVDRVFVGWALGTQGLAGITVCFPSMLIIMAFSMLAGFGAMALISIRLGEKKKDEAERVLGNATVLLVGVSLLVTAAGLLRLDWLLTLSGADDLSLPYARDYLQIILLGAIFQSVGFGLNAVIRGEGNPRAAMFTLLIGVALNALLAPLLIFGFGWGMRGAAVATVLSQAVSMVWVLRYFLGRHCLLTLRLRNLRLDAALCRKILALGSPPFAMQTAASVINIILNNQLRSHGGTLAIAVMGIVYVFMMLIAMPIFGINQGAQPIIGYNYGAARFDRVKTALQTAVLAATTLTVAGFLVAMIFPGQVVWLFNRKDQDYEALATLGTHALRMCLLMLPIVGFQIVSASYFQAVGKPRQAMLLMLSRQILLLIPAVLILPRLFGLDGVWAAIPVADLDPALLTGGCLFLELRHLGRRHAAGSQELGAGVP